MKQMYITKEQIIQRVSSYDILNHYLKPYNNYLRLVQGKNISNPFLAEHQKTPSFNIFVSLPQHEWRFKDFASEDEGSCFDLVMRLYDITFTEVLKKIDVDFNLNLFQEPESQCKSHINPLVEPSLFQSETAGKPYDVTEREFTSMELEYWNEYGITITILNQYHITAISQFTSRDKEGNSYTVKSNPKQFIFAYPYGDGIKVYKPLNEKQYRFQFIGAKVPSFIFGTDQLPTKGDYVFLTGCEKDVLTLADHGFNAICLNSETANLDPSLVKSLKSRITNFFILYDIDDTGISQSEKLSTLHDLKRIVLPSIPNNGKDISDYFSEGLSVEEFEKLLRAAESMKASSFEQEKVIYIAVELISLGNNSHEYLLDPILPKVGTAVIAGKPDTGKSQFGRQLCIQISLRMLDFLGHKLSPTHKRASTSQLRMVNLQQATY